MEVFQNADIPMVLRHASMLLNAAPDSIVIADNSGTILFFNRAAEHLFGFEAEQILGENVRTLVPEPMTQHHDQYVHDYFASKNSNVFGIRREVLARSKDGVLIDVELHLGPVIVGETSLVMAIVSDISHRMKNERRLTEYRNTLEHQNETLRNLQKQSEAACLAKSDFLANMSHEIRTPMTAILGFSELLLEPNFSEEDQRSAIQTIQRNGHHLLNLINDILDLSKVEARKIKLELCQIWPWDVINDVRNLLCEQASSRGNRLLFELRGEIPQTILSDPTRLKQILINLVGNAIKFTNNGTIRIVMECDRLKERLQFQVIDSGIGMTFEQMKQIFNPFQQADNSTTRKYGGTGLGLTVTKQIAELLGGDVTVKSELNKGSTFTLTIDTGPLADVKMVSTLDSVGNTETTPQELQDKVRLEGRILLVEDGPDNQRLISFVLKKAGAEVVLAENGKAGVEAALLALEAGTPFDLILMDMNMPIMDGYTATSLLRDANYPGQIVALTAKAMSGESDKCLAAGCDAYLSKPIDRKTLVAEIALRIRHLSMSD